MLTWRVFAETVTFANCMYLPVINCGIHKHTGYKNQAQVRSNSMCVYK